LLILEAGQNDDFVDEPSALRLAPDNPSRQPTPLPKRQLAIILAIQLAEPVTSITKGDERRTGYFAGIIVSIIHISFVPPSPAKQESIFFAAEALTVLQ
jgi:hypothetical protein